MPPLVMGVLNVTPDSFSDGGRYLDPEAAIAHGLDLFAQGADLVDVGGESTRPGAEPVDPVEEARRVVPVVRELSRHGPVSVDTRHEATARKAVGVGATVLNDVSAALGAVAADLGVTWVAMHMQGTPASMQAAPHYVDVVAEVRDHLVARALEAESAGVREVWIDPGIGFGKTERHNLELLAHLDVLVSTGRPVLVGTSRKRFTGLLHARSDAAAQGLEIHADPKPVAVGDRLEASLAIAVWAVHHGTRVIRTHDVRGTVQALGALTAPPLER